MKDSRNTPESNAEAELRLEAAMKLVEDAQHTLERAAQLLSPIVGASQQCTRVAKEAQRTHDLWRHLAYRVREAGKHKRWFLDGMGDASRARRALAKAQRESDAVDDEIHRRGLGAAFGLLDAAEKTAVRRVLAGAPYGGRYTVERSVYPIAHDGAWVVVDEKPTNGQQRVVLASYATEQLAIEAAEFLGRHEPMASSSKDGAA